MLTEYALTPHLFDDLHNADDPQWLERLRAFGDRLLPTDDARLCNTVVSDLCDGSWYATAFQSLIRGMERRQNEDRTKRLPAVDLLKNLRSRLEERLVRRPFSTHHTQLPENERTQQAKAILDRVRAELGPAAKMVRLFLWRTVKERRFIVGESNGSDDPPKVIWAVAMTHVARPGTDDARQERHTFSLLDRRETSRLASDYDRDHKRNLYPGSPWRQSDP